MSEIDDRLKALDAERASLMALKEKGVENAQAALKEAVAAVSAHLTAAKTIAKSFGISFTLPMDQYKGAVYYPSHDQFIGDDDGYGWSSSSIGC